MITHLKFFAALLVLAPFFSFSQTDVYMPAQKTALKSVDGGYSKRTTDERFEGLYSKNVASQGFELVSLTNGRLSFSLDKNDTLIFTAPDLGNYPKIGVSGTSFGLTRNYHLDFILPKGEIRKVPLSTVIQPKDIYSKNLGLFGYVGPNPDRPLCYIPINVLSKNQRKGSKTELVFAADFDISKVKYALAKVKPNGSCEGYAKATVLNLFDVESGQPINITLELLKKYPKGSMVCVQVSAMSYGSKKYDYVKDIRILIPE